MEFKCPGCQSVAKISDRRIFIRFGYYRRSNDCRVIHIYRCKSCRRTFSRASFDPCYRQLKHQHNPLIFAGLASGVSQRRLAHIVQVNRKTIKRKFLFSGVKATVDFYQHNLGRPQAEVIDIDDAEQILGQAPQAMNSHRNLKKVLLTPLHNHWKNKFNMI